MATRQIKRALSNPAAGSAIREALASAFTHAGMAKTAGGFGRGERTQDECVKLAIGVERKGRRLAQV